MLLDICLGSKSAWRILILYGESPGAGFTRQDIRNNTGLGNKSISFALKRLISFGVLTRTKEDMSLAVYKINKDNKYTQTLIDLLQAERKDLDHLPYDFGIITRELSREIIDSVDVLNIYLFGSVAKGTYREDSDIDFAVVIPEKRPKEDMLISSICDKISAKFNRKIQCFVLTQGQLKKKKGIVEEILKHGIKIL